MVQKVTKAVLAISTTLPPVDLAALGVAALTRELPDTACIPVRGDALLSVLSILCELRRDGYRRVSEVRLHTSTKYVLSVPRGVLAEAVAAAAAFEPSPFDAATRCEALAWL